MRAWYRAKSRGTRRLDAFMTPDADEAVTAEIAGLRRSPWPRFLGPDRSYRLVAGAILRLTGFIYLVAFLVAALQAPALIGEDGLLPVPLFLDRVSAALGSDGSAFLRLPTLFWLGFSDTGLRAVAWTGAALSAAVVCGVSSAAVQLVLWVLYLSIVQVGQRFYGYGWESQLLETGFLTIFLCPLLPSRKRSVAPPFVTVVLLRWLIVRIMLGAGFIKLRGDPCWTDLTCLVYHYETQPIPHPLSPFFHHLPVWVHEIGTLANHLVEVVAPFFAFGPRRARLIAGVAFVGFQCVLIASGNLSFLNWLTIVPALACFDDDFLHSCAQRLHLPTHWNRAREAITPGKWQRRVALGYGGIVALLSINPVVNLISPRQAMNRSFDPLHLVNTYGAFGSVGKIRHEVIIEGTASTTPDENADWREYEFPCKPGSVTRRPCWLTPYHSRIDWQLWFAALGDVNREPWLAHLIYELLQGDPMALSLLSYNPFPAQPPRYIRVTYYRYEMTNPYGSDGPFGASGAWWRRERIGTYLRPVSLESPQLRGFLQMHGWLPRD